MEEVMTMSSCRRFVAVTLLVGLILTLTLLRPNHARAQGQPQYPIMDKIAAKLIQKYQSSSCEQLWVKKSQKAPPTPEEIRAVEILRSDPQMRAAFINKVAAPIANKMFECELIP
jgi:hypothetical protein